MSHLSQESVLLWCILSCLLLCFLIWHLWKFDKFQCLMWDRTRGSGGFKRIMTYSYLCSVPLLVFYSVTLAAIKYNEGFIVTPPMNVHPLPVSQWNKSARTWMTVLYVAFSLSWALEIVSHLEELNFWLFLLASKPEGSWLHSVYFHIWGVGSLLALGGLPTVAIITRHDTLKSEAWIFFTGSTGSLIITLCFLYVLWKFPNFIALIQEQGADPETIVRLETYSQLNNLRIVFRFLFVVPLFILAVDGIRPGHTHEINTSTFATDLLAMVGGVGCFISSVITLLIFFPRSISREEGYTLTMSIRSQSSHDVFGEYQLRERERGLGFGEQVRRSRQGTSLSTPPNSIISGENHRKLRAVPPSQSSSRSVFTGFSVKSERQMHLVHSQASPGRLVPLSRHPLPEAKLPHGRPRLRADEGDRMKDFNPDIQTAGIDIELRLEDMLYEEMQAKGMRHSRVAEAPGILHPYILNFKSPLDAYDQNV